jgi:hypothetical protein
MSHASARGVAILGGMLSSTWGCLTMVALVAALGFGVFGVRARRLTRAVESVASTRGLVRTSPTAQCFRGLVGRRWVALTRRMVPVRESTSPSAEKTAIGAAVLLAAETADLSAISDAQESTVKQLRLRVDCQNLRLINAVFRHDGPSDEANLDLLPKPVILRVFDELNLRPREELRIDARGSVEFRMDENFQGHVNAAWLDAMLEHCLVMADAVDPPRGPADVRFPNLSA